MWRALQSIFAALLFIGLTGWLCDRYFFALPRNNLTAGEIAEMGDFARAPRYRDLVETYLDNLKEYRSLNFTAISSPDDVDGIAGALAPSLAGLPESAGLARHLAVLIARCAGMDSAEYLRNLPGVAFNIPQHSLGHLRWAADLYLPGENAPDQNADPADVQAVFEKFYALGKTYRSGSGRVTAFAGQGPGFRVAVVSMPAGTAFDVIDALDKQLTPAEQDFYWGKLSFGDLVLTTPPPESLEATTVLRSSVCIIMKTAGGDIYPFHFNSYYDAAKQKWFLLTAERACSPRMGNTPPIVY
jgi:hypothetical protein